LGVAEDHDGDRVVEEIDTVTIIGKKVDAADVPGSAHVIDSEELETYLNADILRVLRSVPGVYIQEEEGFGLRPNIGIRGSGLDRSARIALLEDGVLVAPAPYAASSAYYFPTQRRMSAVEILKGPAAVAVGPRTTGGAMNMISTPIPDAMTANLDVRGGDHSTLDAHVYVGGCSRRCRQRAQATRRLTDPSEAIRASTSKITSPSSSWTVTRPAGSTRACV
jgi:Fe(3+) dicitrate transport protein